MRVRPGELVMMEWRGMFVAGLSSRGKLSRRVSSKQSPTMTRLEEKCDTHS
jgi:hypothetical protein